MNNEQQKNKTNPTDKNKQYLIIAIITTVICVFAIILLMKLKGTDETPVTNSNTNAPQISVVSQSGDYTATIDADIAAVRKLRLGMKKSKVMNMEKKMKDTNDGSDSGDASDGSGISFVSYSFVDTAKKAPEFFGAQVILSDPHANLTYEFKNDKLAEIRINFGTLGDSYDSIVEKNKAAYGEPSHVREYSNGNKSTFWRTKDCMLTLYLQDNMRGGYDVLAYYSDVQ